MKSNLTTQRSGTEIPVRIEDARLSIVVPFTTAELTKAALTHAVALSAGLNARVRLIDPQVVPMQRALGEPPINREFQTNRLREIAESAGMPVEVEMIYTRDRMECFRRRVEAGALVVIAAGMPWWPTAEKKLARLLLRAGYDVVLVPRNPMRGVR